MSHDYWILVPGLLGSRLSCMETMADGTEVETPIWSDNITVNFQTLRSRPQVLNCPSVRQSIIRTMRSPVRSIDVYGNLCDRLEQLAANHGGQVTFVPFAYDWRQEVELSAHKLLDFVNAIEGLKRVVFIGHSLGGVVVRKALTMSSGEALRAKTSGFLQIASPVGGSLKAYELLQGRPTFDGFINPLWGILVEHFIAAENYHKFKTSVSSWGSLYELLPNDQVLKDEAGRLYSPLSEQFWTEPPKVSQEHYTAIANIPFNSLGIRYRVVYGIESRSTLSGFIVALDGRILRASERVDGDGTVTCASALIGSPSDGYIPVRGRQGGHLRICRSHEVERALRHILSTD